MLLLCSGTSPNLRTGDGVMETNVCLHFSRIPWAGCSRTATSAAGFLLPMGTTSCNTHSCPDSPNPPSAVTLRSLPALLSVRISFWQIFTRACSAGRAVSQGGWRGPMPWREALAGTERGAWCDSRVSVVCGATTTFHHPPA